MPHAEDAVCPPVIVALAGASVARFPDVTGHNKDHNDTDWEDVGLWVATELALDAVAPCRRTAVLERLCETFSATALTES